MPGEYFSGKDAHIAVENASSVLTVLSDVFDVTGVECNPTTDRFTVKPFKAPRAKSIAGHTQELWTVRGPTTVEAVDFWEPLSNLPAGKNKAYVFGPYNNTDGQLAFEGLLDVLDFVPHATVNADGVPEFSATLSIITKTSSIFAGGSPSPA